LETVRQVEFIVASTVRWRQSVVIARRTTMHQSQRSSVILSRRAALRCAALRFPAMSHMSPSFVALVIYARRRKRRQLNISALKLLPTQCHIDGTRDTSTLQIIGYQIR